MSLNFDKLKKKVQVINIFNLQNIWVRLYCQNGREIQDFSSHENLEINLKIAFRFIQFT